jgi:hypothetical protein
MREIEITVKEAGHHANEGLPTLAVVVNDQRGKQSVSVLFDTEDFSGWAWVVGVLQSALSHAQANMQLERQIAAQRYLAQQADTARMRAELERRR